MDPNRVCPNCLKEMPRKGGECPFCGYEEGTQELSARCLPPYTVLQGRYFIGTVIGEGGFGITYRGWDLTDNRKVAIKEFFPVGLVTRDTSHGGDNTVQSISGQMRAQYQSGLQKYENEARCLMKLRGLPGIVNILNFFHENSTAYIVMEFLEGMTMREYLVRNQGCLPEQKALEMMKPLMYSLDSIHRAGIVHRDISPDNIIVQPDGKLKLIDFGAARQSTGNQTQSLTVVLKHGYAPEEQYRSQGKQGPFTDVYALCATLYKILTGITPVEALARMFEDELKPLHQFPNNISSQTCVAITKGMAVRAAERYQTVSELAAALYENRPKPIPAGSNVPVKPKKKLWPIFAGSVLLVAILGIIFWPKTRYTFEILPKPVVGNYRYEIHSNIPELDKADIQWTLKNVCKNGEPVDAPVLNELSDQSAVVQEGWDYTFTLVASCQYQGKTYANIFNQSEPPLLSIEILNLPEKTEYQLGETVDLAGMDVSLSYSNGEEITANADETAFSIIPEVLEESGTQAITIQQGDKTVTFEVTVTDPKAEEEKANADAYAEAVKLKDKGSYKEAKAAFEALGDYSDAKDQASACQKALDDIAAKEAAETASKAEQAQVSQTAPAEVKQSEFTQSASTEQKAEETQTKFFPIKAGGRASLCQRLFNMDKSLGLVNRTYTENPFVDVSVDTPQYQAILWCVNEGYINGNGEYFNPGKDVTRAEFCTVLYRYARKHGIGLPATKAAKEFTDQDEIPAYAKDAVSAFQRAGIISGYPDGSLKPNAMVSEIEMINMIQRFCMK